MFLVFRGEGAREFHAASSQVSRLRSGRLFCVSLVILIAQKPPRERFTVATYLTWWEAQKTFINAQRGASFMSCEAAPTAHVKTAM